MTEPLRSPYEVLGVGADAGTAEIRQAYVALARRFHPDHVDPRSEGAAEAGRRMQEINEAWEVLGDAARRRRFDASQRRPFRPFAPDDPDEPDPRLAPDVPYRAVVAPSPGRRAVTMAPVLLLASAVTVGSLGITLGYGGLVTVAVALFSLACAGFVAVPLLALGRASRDEG
ncbi:MAG: J domain-containing protein [Acidobacteria bacterium]|nr:J domain-containing protein [Acidobacteriota bacterium]